MKSSIVAILSLAALILPATDFAAAQTPPPALHVQGNHLVDPNGNIVRLLGVNISGTEYACSQPDGKGFGFGDGPVLQYDGSVNTAAITALKSWNVNAVRVPLNEDCWLGINLSNQYIGQPYRNAIIAYVKALNDVGLYVVFDLHWAAPGTKVAGKIHMADADHGPVFWTSVATAFKDNHAVLFDLYNEPAWLLGGETFAHTTFVGTTADWDCWLNGCTLYLDTTGAGPGNQPYQTAGMKQLVAAVRNAGATQPVLLAGLWYAQDTGQWVTYAGMLNDTQIVLSYHPYCGPRPTNTADCITWENDVQANIWPGIATIAASYPVVSSEFGEYDCLATTFVNAYMAFADQNGISYLGFAFNTQSCSNFPALITDNAGTPTAYGAGLKSHLATLVPTVTAVSPTSGTALGGTPMTVTGTNFSGARAVNFGSTAVTSLTVNPNGTSISVTSPPGTGTVDVTVTTYLATSAVNANDQFTYSAAPPPTVTSVSSSANGTAAGPTAGGTAVTINGTDLSGATAVHFGATSAASFSNVTAGQMTATSPSGSQGPVDITVTTPAGTSPTSAADRFTYVNPPGFSAQPSPARGPVAGGQKIILSGSGFTYATAVNFGANPAQSFEIDSDSSITAISPHGSGGQVNGNVNIAVVTPGGTTSTLFAQYIYVCGPHDFNGDGKSDIAWRDSSGNTAAWLMNGAQVLVSGTYGVVPLSWQIVGQRDFAGFGRCDLLWRDSSGNLAIWLLTGTLLQQAGSLGNVPTTWTVVGTSDFNADGIGDILWRDNAGNVAIWLMNGGFSFSVLQAGVVGSIPINWTIKGTDGTGHILWQDMNSGTVAIWTMNGLTVAKTVNLGAVPSNWQIKGTGDFDGDGVMDILWQDSNTSTVALWLLSSSMQAWTPVTLGAVPAPWSITVTGDYNGDSYSDILWRNTTTGDVAIWFLTPSQINGVQLSSAAGVGNVPTAWTIQGANAE